MFPDTFSEFRVTWISKPKTLQRESYRSLELGKVLTVVIQQCKKGNRLGPSRVCFRTARLVKHLKIGII